MDKKSLRAIKWQQRKVFPESLKLIYDQKITKTCLSLVEHHECISTYISIKDEINSRLLINELHLMNKIVCCPVLKGDEMEMHQLNNLENVVRRPMDLLEPTSNIECQPTLVFVPLLAFNEMGYRIGYGKGYYDRYLSNWNCLKVGLAYSWMLEDFKEDEYDVRLDYIVTEKEIISFINEK